MKRHNSRSAMLLLLSLSCLLLYSCGGSDRSSLDALQGEPLAGAEGTALEALGEREASFLFKKSVRRAWDSRWSDRGKSKHGRCRDPLPGMVQGLTCSTGLPDRIELSWDPVRHADGYEIWRRADDGSDWELIWVDDCLEWFDDVDLEECVYYHYKVRAFNCAGFGEFCDICTGWIGTDPEDCCRLPIPDMVQIVKCSTGLPDRIQLKWRPVRHAEGYEIWRRADDGSDWLMVGSADTESWADMRGLEECVRYEYKIRAFNCAGVGEFCDVCVGWIGTNPDDCFPDTPDCGPCEGQVSNLTLSWDGSRRAHIEVRQKKGGDTVFSGNVAAGGEFSFSGVTKQDTLGPDIIIFVNGKETQRIHTSCSLPIGAGMSFGDFTVVAGDSRRGGPLCPVDDDPGKPKKPKKTDPKKDDPPKKGDDKDDPKKDCPSSVPPGPAVKGVPPGPPQGVPPGPPKGVRPSTPGRQR